MQSNMCAQLSLLALLSVDETYNEKNMRVALNEYKLNSHRKHVSKCMHSYCERNACKHLVIRPLWGTL